MPLDRIVLSTLGVAASCSLAASAQVHFRLEAPAAATAQSSLGDPQKAPPCGDDGSAEPTGQVTAYRPGETITVTVDETIFHPGHYRVALAVGDPSELPEPPPVTAGATPCGSTVIDTSPSFPVLADGVLVHTAPFDGPQSFEVVLPEDVTCTRCTLQVIEFMSDHGLNDPGGCYYHHCATIAITDDGSGGSTSGGSGEAPPAPGGGTSGGSSDASSGDRGGGVEANGGSVGGEVSAPSPESSDGGCAVQRSRAAAGLTSWLALLGALALRRRARR